jgi:hypothetical protein
MLVVNNKGVLLKKATGRITFVCKDGQMSVLFKNLWQQARGRLSDEI